MARPVAAALAVSLSLVFAAVAIALTNNTVNYDSTIAQKKMADGDQNLVYTGTLDIGTSDGTQPNTAPLTELFFAKQLRNNGTDFPSCKVSDVDGKTEIPDKCEKAVVGGGRAAALVGQPGSSNSIRQELTVVAINGHGGKKLMLALIGGAVTSYRVIPGDIAGAPSPYAYKVGFKVPPELQGQLGTQIALINFEVKINKNKKITVVKKKNGKKTKTKVSVSYLQLKNCPRAGLLPVRAVVHFNNDDNSPGGQVVPDDGTMTCQ
jgi:hypothetical protein